MRVGIDCRELFIEREWAGMAQRLYQLVTRCPALASDLEYRLFFSFVRSRHISRVSPLLTGKSKLRIARLPAPVTRCLLDRGRIPIELFVGRIDIFHGPVFYIPPGISCKKVMTIHDLMFYRFPQFLPPDVIDLFDNITRKSIRRADHVIAVSQFTRNDVVDLLGYPEDRISVIENGVSDRFHPVREREEIDRVLRKYGIDRPYILFVGTAERKKNLAGLLSAYKELREGERIDELLVVAGGNKWAFEEFLADLKEKGLEKEVRCTGYVAQEELPCLYSGAELFVFPSLFEGGGIPPLEAMACGTPVVTSAVTAIPEMVGDAAVLVNPRDPHDIAEGIFRILSDGDFRADLVSRGLERAKILSWDRCAKKVVDLYRELA